MNCSFYKSSKVTKLETNKVRRHQPQRISGTRRLTSSVGSASLVFREYGAPVANDHIPQTQVLGHAKCSLRHVSVNKPIDERELRIRSVSEKYLEIAPFVLRMSTIS